MEIWKPLYGFPSYNGSSEGRIVNIKTQHILTPTADEHGNLKVNLQRNNRWHTVKVRRVIAETFLGEHPGMDVRHRDGDRSNVRADNLEWVTRSELIQDAYDRGTKRPYQSIRIKVVETGVVYDTITACAMDIGCSRSEICKYLAGKLSHVRKLHFERVDSHA